MIEFWFLAMSIGLAMIVVMIVAALLRKKHLQRKVRLEIVNQGNMPSRYQLRATEPAGDLSFCFSLDGDPLPEQAAFDEDLGAEATEDAPRRLSAPATLAVTPSSHDAEGGVQQETEQAIRRASSFAGTLTALGTVLPRPLGAPLMRAASRLQQGQIRLSRAQRVPRRVASLRKKPAAPGESQSRSAAQPTGSAHRSEARIWAETPSLAPGKSLTIDLLVRSASASKDQHHTFQVVSRSIEGKDAPQVVVEGSVRIRGGFWTRRFLPQIIIVVLAVLALAVLTLLLAT